MRRLLNIKLNNFKKFDYQISSFILVVFSFYSGVVSAQPSSSLRESATNPVLTHHSLRVKIDPFAQTIEVDDLIKFSNGKSGTEKTFNLNANLEITNRPRRLQKVVSEDSVRSSRLNAMSSNTAAKNIYTVSLPRRRSDEVLLSYSGKISDVIVQFGNEYAQSFAETSGIIASEGVYLNKNSAWVPDFGDEFITFDLSVEFEGQAEEWLAISQGDRGGRNAWVSDKPVEEIYLIAGAFTEYINSDYNDAEQDSIQKLAYLRTPDINLATRYLDATARYLALYEPLLGDYPYSKFALVENFWETGYGMPSFTFLGEKIIRFPFILESSYPHEILHNWWGNGVYPDYETGNWSEGLTAYLADHLFQEMDGNGAKYRKEMLSRYRNYVGEGVDFPLKDFTARNSAASQAIGYGKTLMLWHMLRKRLGDDLFLEGLRTFYADFLFKRASFADIALHFSSISGEDLTSFFSQWVDRVGAPEITLSVDKEQGNQARLMFAQVQDELPYQIKMPVALFYADEPDPVIVEVDLSERLEGFLAEDYDSLEAVIADPRYDFFRQLDVLETAPSIGSLFGSDQVTFILPANDEKISRSEWRALAEAFGAGLDMQIFVSDAIDTLPEDRDVWIIGRDNRWLASLNTAAADYGLALNSEGLKFDENILGLVEYSNRSSVATVRHPADPSLTLGFIHIDNVEAVSGIIEKLPHYGKYSYLSFEGVEPVNDIKGTWASEGSPLMWEKAETKRTYGNEDIQAIPPLAQLPPKYLPSGLSRHITVLADVEMAGRGIGTEELNRAGDYIAGQFRLAGLLAPEGSYKQSWRQMLTDGSSVDLFNVVGLLPGTNPELENSPVVVGAHYDHLGANSNGEIFPGADDNASGVSVLIEVAAKLRRSFSPERPILFVAFSAEESGLLGSEYFADHLPFGIPAEQVFAMLNLDSVGRLEGKSLQLFGSGSAYEFPFMAQGIGFTIGLQSEMPERAISSSDHSSFLKRGVPALHLFSGIHGNYHRTSDSVDLIDLDGMSQISLWLEEALTYLANNVEPLRVTLANAPSTVQRTGLGNREASLGTMPDFNYSGDGIRVEAVLPESAASAAGLLAGDVLISFNNVVVDNLQVYSNLLRESEPGDNVRLEVLRGQELIQLRATLRQR